MSNPVRNGWKVFIHAQARPRVNKEHETARVHPGKARKVFLSEPEGHISAFWKFQTTTRRLYRWAGYPPYARISYSPVVAVVAEAGLSPPLPKRFCGYRVDVVLLIMKE